MSETEDSYLETHEAADRTARAAEMAQTALFNNNYIAVFGLFVQAIKALRVTRLNWLKFLCKILIFLFS